MIYSTEPYQYIDIDKLPPPPREDASAFVKHQYYAKYLVPAPSKDLLRSSIDKPVTGLWDTGERFALRVKYRTEFFWFLAREGVNLLNVMIFEVGDEDHIRTHIAFRQDVENTISFKRYLDWYTDTDTLQVQWSGNLETIPKNHWQVRIPSGLLEEQHMTMGLYEPMSSLGWAIWKFVRLTAQKRVWYRSRGDGTGENIIACEDEGDAILLAQFLEDIGMLEEPKYDAIYGALKVSPAFTAPR